MFSAPANHSSVAKRILAELALEERLSRFVVVLVMLLFVYCVHTGYHSFASNNTELNEQIPMWIYSTRINSTAKASIGTKNDDECVACDRKRKILPLLTPSEHRYYYVSRDKAMLAFISVSVHHAS